MARTKVQLVSNIVGNVSGGASFTGIVTASSFVGNGANLTGIANTANIVSTAITTGTLNVTTSAVIGSGVTINSSGINVTGIVTASSFVGNGASLSGISTLGNIEISSGIITTTASYFELYKPVLFNYSERVNVIGNTGASCNINLANGAYVTATLNQTTTFTFTTGVTVGALGFALQLTNGSGGPYTITWPASVYWPNNAIPTRTTTDSKTDVWVFNSIDNGTKWYGNLALYNFS